MKGAVVGLSAGGNVAHEELGGLELKGECVIFLFLKTMGMLGMVFLFCFLRISSWR